MITQFLDALCEAVASLSTNTLLLIVWGAFAFIFLLALVLCFLTRGVRRADKRPFLALTNAFAAVTLAVLLTRKELSYSVLASALFWCVGYLLYGALVLASRRMERAERVRAHLPLPSAPPPVQSFPPAVSPSRANVRAEHAISVTEKLLAKNLGRGDRQEVERIKAALYVMQLKGSLSPEENERLNDNFNTLLKLMAKYGV